MEGSSYHLRRMRLSLAFASSAPGPFEALDRRGPSETGPADLAANIHQLANDGRAVANFDIRVRQFTRADALDEIVDVRRALPRTLFGRIRRRSLVVDGIPISQASRNL